MPLLLQPVPVMCTLLCAMEAPSVLAPVVSVIHPDLTCPLIHAVRLASVPPDTLVCRSPPRADLPWACTSAGGISFSLLPRRNCTPACHSCCCTSPWLLLRSALKALPSCCRVGGTPAPITFLLPCSACLPSLCLPWPRRAQTMPPFDPGRRRGRRLLQFGTSFVPLLNLPPRIALARCGLA